MRIYINVYDAFRETERDLWEIGIDVHPETMQDKQVKDDEGYKTKELQSYGFQIVRQPHDKTVITTAVNYLFTPPNATEPPHEKLAHIQDYIAQEFEDRISCKSLNPGNSWKYRPDVWEQFLHLGKFSYTYSERMAPQLMETLRELQIRSSTRQAIITIHSTICPDLMVEPSEDLFNRGGKGRIPCSMYYQIMIRNSKVDLIYTMRSCDFLTHFPIDIALALKLQSWFAEELRLSPGVFTYFTGSLHAYVKDMKERGIF